MVATVVGVEATAATDVMVATVDAMAAATAGVGEALVMAATDVMVDAMVAAIAAATADAMAAGVLDMPAKVARDTPHPRE